MKVQLKTRSKLLRKIRKMLNMEPKDYWVWNEDKEEYDRKYGGGVRKR